MKRTWILAGCVAALGLGTAALMAGGGGRAGGGGAGGGGMGGGGAGGGGMGGGMRGGGGLVNQLDTYRQDMAVVDDGEWGAISNRIVAVTTARTLANPNAGRGGVPGGGRRGAVAGAATTATGDSDAVAALRKDYDDKAPTPAIKADIGKVLAEHKANEAAYIKAQDDLRLLLTARQEAYLTLNGVLR